MILLLLSIFLLLWLLGLLLPFGVCGSGGSIWGYMLAGCCGLFCGIKSIKTSIYGRR